MTHMSLVEQYYYFSEKNDTFTISMVSPFFLVYRMNKFINPLSDNVMHARHDVNVTCNGCSASYRQNH